MKKLTLLLALFALVPFALAACGGDDDEDEEPVPPPPPAKTGGGGGGGGGGGAKAVSVSADPGGGLAFEQKTLEAPAGKVTFEFENEATLGHDFCIEEDGEESGCTDVISESSDTLETKLEAGDEYTFYCSVPGHREGGMEGTLTVK